jgi:hypothetical protein
VNGGHESALDAEGVLEDLGQRAEAVGGAGGVGDDVVVRRVVVAVVDAEDDGEVLVGGGARSGPSWRPASMCFCASAALVKKPVDSIDDVDIQVGPGQVRRVALG